jgi:hypothetical protein
MLNFTFVVLNALVSVATYHFFTQNVVASVVGFLTGCAFWFLVFND